MENHNNNVVIKKSYLTAQNNQILLVSVENGTHQIGVTDLGLSGFRNTYFQDSIFHVGVNPVLKISTPLQDSNSSDKLISFFNSGKCDKKVKSIIDDVYKNYFINEETRDVVLDPLLEMLKSGLYAVYMAKVYPTDGAGTFFWNAFNIRHEVKGSARKISAFGDKPYTPCFLIPTHSPVTFNYGLHQNAVNNNKNDTEFYGIAYHLSGLHSVLLKGHHSAAASISSEKDFYCLIIEQIDFLFHENEKASNKVIGFSGVSMSLPFEYISTDMIENALLTRRGERSQGFYQVKKILSATPKQTGKIAFPADFAENALNIPDTEMVISAKSVGALSQQQLDALLLGETEYDGQVIISPNYYQSIVTASNYLQFISMESYIEFTLTIMNNPDLTGVHEYLCNRLLKIHDKRIYDFYKTILDEHDTFYAHLQRFATKYCNRFEAREKKEKEQKADKDSISLRKAFKEHLSS